MKLYVFQVVSQEITRNLRIKIFGYIDIACDIALHIILVMHARYECFGDSYKMLMTALINLVTNILFIFTLASVTNIRKMSPTSTNRLISHQHHCICIRFFRTFWWMLFHLFNIIFKWFYIRRLFINMGWKFSSSMAGLFGKTCPRLRVRNFSFERWPSDRLSLDHLILFLVYVNRGLLNWLLIVLKISSRFNDENCMLSRWTPCNLI